MNESLTVAILDDNRYFIHGMQNLLLHHFSARNCAVRFVSPTSCEMIDLLIQAESAVGWPRRPCKQPGDTRSTAVLTIKKGPRDRLRRSKPSCLSHRGVIDRRDPLDDVLRLIEQTLAQRVVVNSVPSCEYCDLSLTAREREVLCGMAELLAPGRLSELLNLSPKTVSAHKRAAMRKLGFKYSHELYYWLRQGGLEPEKRSLF